MIQKIKTMGILKFLLNKPFFRHLTAGLFIVLLLFVFSIRPLEKENRELRKHLNFTIERQHLLIEKLSAKDTYSITNAVDAKIKKGGRVQLIPENKMKIVNNNDTLKEKRKPKKWWKFWR